jgi:hypothetical protein
VLFLCAILGVANFLEAWVAPLHPLASVLIAVGKAVGFSLVSLMFARAIVAEYVRAGALESGALSALNAVSAFIVPLVLYSILFVSFEAGAWGILVTFSLAFLPLLEVHFSHADHTEDFPVHLFSFLRHRGLMFGAVQLASTLAFFLLFLVLALVFSLLFSERTAPLISVAVLAPLISAWLVFRMELFLELQLRDADSNVNEDDAPEEPRDDANEVDGAPDDEDTSVDEEPRDQDETVETQDEEYEQPKRRRR